MALLPSDTGRSRAPAHDPSPNFVDLVKSDPDRLTGFEINQMISVYANEDGPGPDLRTHLLADSAGVRATLYLDAKEHKVIGLMVWGDKMLDHLNFPIYSSDPKLLATLRPDLSIDSIKPRETKVSYRKSKSGEIFEVLDASGMPLVVRSCGPTQLLKFFDVRSAVNGDNSRASVDLKMPADAKLSSGPRVDIYEYKDSNGVAFRAFHDGNRFRGIKIEIDGKFRLCSDPAVLMRLFDRKSVRLGESNTYTYEVEIGDHRVAAFCDNQAPLFCQNT